MPRIIDRHTQLITQSNDCCLLTFSEMKVVFERAWDIMEFTKNPEETVFLHPNKSLFAERSPWIGYYLHSENIPLYRQKMRVLHIHKNGRVFNNDRFPFYLKNKALFIRFINIKNKNGLENLMRMVNDFCIFPNKQERLRLNIQYKKSVGEKIQHFILPIHTPHTKEEQEKYEKIAKEIRDINTDYIFEKQQWLRKLVDSYDNGKMKIRELALLYRYMTQVSEIFLDQDDFNLKKLFRDMDVGGDGIIHDTRNSNELLGEKNVQDVKELLLSYRVYGHFALCCLEFFLAIKEKRKIAICESCKRYYEKKHKSAKYCSAKCIKKGSLKRSQKYRYNKTK